MDKTVAVLLALEDGPADLAALVRRTGLTRPTAHRLACALEVHGLVGRDADRRFILGDRLRRLTQAAAADPLLAAAGPALARLRDTSGESAQLYRREGDFRRCVAAAERAAGLRDTVPVGSLLPITAGSAAQVLLAWAPREEVLPVLARARFSSAVLATVRRRGWAASVAERDAGVASVSAPVRDRVGSVLAAVSVSGPIDRLTRSPGRLHAGGVLTAAEALRQALER